MKVIENDDLLYNAYSYYRTYYEDNYESHNIMRIKTQPVPVKSGFIKGIYDWHNEEMIKLIKCKQKHVKDGIGKDYMDWIPRVPILIDFPTGGGKNTWIMEELLPYCIKHNEKILIIVNRVALARQVKLDAAKRQKIKFPKDFNNRELDTTEVIGCITVRTYQKMINDMKYFHITDKRDPNYIDRDFKYIYSDETHYYVSDASFSSRTYALLVAFRKYYSHVIRIYGTSTPDEIVPWLIKVEKDLPILERSDRICSPALTSILCPIEMKCYIGKRNYSFVNAKYFRSKEEIIELILSDHSGKKWLIFVKSKADGAYFQEKLGDQAIFIDASSKEENGKNHETYEEIVKQQKFSKRILVTTTVLDNGVNIVDPMVLNVVLMTTDKTTFIQTLGRKRIRKDEKIKLYIKNLNSQEINNYIFSIKEKLDAYDLYNESIIGFKDKYLAGTTEDHEKVKNLFYFDDKGKIEWNPIALKKLKDDKKNLEKISAKISPVEPNAFIKEQLSWIGLLKTFDEDNYVDFKKNEKHLNEFLTFLEQLVDKPLNKEEQEKLSEDFKDKCIKAFGKRMAKDGTSLDRNDRKYGIEIMQERLTTNNLPYTIESANGVWTIKRKVNAEVLE